MRLLMDYEVQRCTRHCIQSGRELVPGEKFYSALVKQGAQVIRHDYAAEAWAGPPEGTLGWWKSQLAAPHTTKKQWAPNEVMLELFEQLAGQPGTDDTRYVLALLLVRRRVMRLEESQPEEPDVETLRLYCPRRDAEFTVRVSVPSEERTTEIQAELARLLSAAE